MALPVGDLSVAAAACSKSSPIQPSSPGASAAASRGAVVEALTGAPIDGATLTFTLGGTVRTLTTAGGGLWELADARLPEGVTLEAAAPGYLTRRTNLHSVTKNGSVSIDLIKDASPFSLDYYRQLIRNQLDAPGSLLPLKRWTKNPAFYVNTKNPRTGGELSSSERDLVHSIIQRVVPQMTGGHLAVGAIEFAPAARAEKSGVVNVTFVNDPANEFCGWSRVGSDPGAITLNLTSRCDTPCGTIPPRTLAHEVAHALGFYHVAEGAVLSTNWSPQECGSTTMSWLEQHHARLAYSRPQGNRDADFDPLMTLFATSDADTPATVSCRSRK